MSLTDFGKCGLDLISIFNVMRQLCCELAVNLYSDLGMKKAQLKFYSNTDFDILLHYFYNTLIIYDNINYT